jgi:hypothetical protein
MTKIVIKYGLLPKSEWTESGGFYAKSIGFKNEVMVNGSNEAICVLKVLEKIKNKDLFHIDYVRD